MTSAAQREQARDWLFGHALPLWHERGADREHGGWFEKIAQDGTPLPVAKRCRVQARQTFVYAHAGERGWDGDWRFAVRHGIDFLLSRYRRDDGLYRKSVRADGTPDDDGFDLYDQAFVLLGLERAFTAFNREQRYRDAADALLAQLTSRLRHPIAGFQEDAPPRLPLRSNPHMHLLEALLAWVEAGADDLYRDLSGEIVDLATQRMIDPATGAIGEYFDADWRAMPDASGGVREPGHQFEWAYLLRRADTVLGGDHRAASERLYTFGRDHGVDPIREVAVFALDAAGSITDPDARLWSQTERLRTALTLGDERAGDEAFATLQRFLDVPVRGLWRDRMRPDGSFVDEPAPASSFYHIVSGLLPLIA